MRKIIYHIKKWNEWRKDSLNSPIFKFIVLLKIGKAPTFDYFWIKEDVEFFVKGFEAGIGRIGSEKDDN